MVAFGNNGFAQNKLPLTVGTSVTHPTCQGSEDGSITMLASGGQAPYRYLWTNGDTTSTVSGLTTGTYEVIVSDATQATVQAIITLVSPNPILINATIQHVRSYGGADGQIDLDIDAENYTFFWTGTGGTHVDIHSLDQTALESGTYTIHVTSENGCSAQHSFQVIQPLPGIKPLIHAQSIPFKGNDATQNLIGIYPNPSNGVIHFNGNEHISSIMISNMNGHRIANVSKSDLTQSLHLEKGTYTACILLTSGESVYERIIVE